MKVWMLIVRPENLSHLSAVYDTFEGACRERLKLLRDFTQWGQPLPQDAIDIQEKSWVKGKLDRRAPVRCMDCGTTFEQTTGFTQALRQEKRLILCEECGECRNEAREARYIESMYS